MTMVKGKKAVDAIGAALHIEHLNTVLKGLFRFRELSEEKKHNPHFFQDACNCFTEIPAYSGMWIITIGPKRNFEGCYHSGQSTFVDSLIKQFQEGRLPPLFSKALKAGEVVITEDLSAKPPEGDLSKYGTEMSAMTCYLIHEGDIFGLISASIPKSLSHDNIEIELFKKISEEVTRQLCKQSQYQTCIRHGAKIRFESVLLGSVHQAVAATDTDGRILYWNGPAEMLFGWRESEVLGKQLIDLLSFNPEYEKSDEIIDGIRTGLLWSGEAHLKRHDGSVFPALVSTSPVQSEGGTRIGTLALAIDLHPYKQAESKLSESETRFRTVFERSPGGIVLIGPDLKVTKANPAFCEMTGYTEDELKEKSVADITHPDDIETDINAKKKLLRNELASYKATKRFIHKNGETRWAILVSSLVQDTDHQPLYLLSHVIDITEQKKTEEALLQSEIEFRQLFERLTSAVLVFEIVGNGNDFVFKNINAAGERLIKNTKPDIIGKRILDAFPRAETIGLLHALREVSRTNEAKFLPLSHYTDQRLSQWLETHLYKLPSGEIVAVCDDRTDERELEEQLLQSQKMDAIGQLAGGIAHDFNNQLTGILGYAEMLKPKLTDQKQLQYLYEIIESGKRSTDLIKQLLAFSRKGQYELIPVDLHKTISEVVSLLQCSLDKRILIKLRLNAALPITKGDPSQLHNAILNLAINARDAMPQGGEITFETGTTDLDKDTCRLHHYTIAPGKYLKISVTDTGIGIDKETLKHIFEPFFTTKPVGRGTGMGLPAVYGTVKKLSGAIDVTSELGHGTTFSLLFPLTNETVPSESASRHVLQPTSPRHILIAEDEDHIGRLVSEFLEGLNYTVTLCKNGNEAVKIYRDSWPVIDVVILDIIMPEMSGSDTFLALRNINPRVKVLMFSGYSMEEEVQKIIKEGNLEFLQKPFAMDDLAAKIKGLLQ